MSEIKESFRAVLGSYPEIAEKIKFFWGEPEFSELVHNLINDTRHGARRGFPMEVTSALITLQHWHDYHFPKCAKGTGKEWSLHSRSNVNNALAS